MKVTSDLFQLKVLVNSKPIQEYHKDSKTFVEGRQGSNFELLLKNLTPRRLLVHPTVDGLSAMTGKEASRNDYSEGYVLNPFQEMSVPGWRLDNESVARFLFAGEGRSYAEQTGQPKNKGVIAAAVWEERIPTWQSKVMFNIETSDSITFTDGTDNADPVGGIYNVNTEPASHGGEELTIGSLYTPERGEKLSRGRKRRVSTKSVNNLGTGFGKKADHNVMTVKFEINQAEPDAIAVIYYDDFRGLATRGIKISRKPQSDSLPNPFPKDTGCVPPHGWRG